jgi:Family of unknown function (DUF6199)
VTDTDLAAVFMLTCFFVVGLWLTIWPGPAWRLRHRFSFKNPEDVEPSEGVLAYYRVSGLVSLGLAIFLWIRYFQ